MIHGLQRACAIALCALGTGCASMSDNECRTANWYQRGEQDGLIGLQPRLDMYSSQCARHGVQPAASDYMQGWQSGNFEHFKRSDQHMG
jgi:Protein of unknown function (DUF2799)